MNQNFEEYMTEFNAKDLKEKQEIIYTQLKLLAAYSNAMCKNLNIKNEILLSKDLLDMKNKNYTEDEFANTMIVLINSVQESINDFTIGLSNILDNIANNK